MVRHKTVPNKEYILSQDNYDARYFLPTEQFVMKISGRLLSGFVREGPNRRFHEGTIFNYAVSVIIWAENQIYLGLGNSTKDKQQFKEWLWEQADVKVQHYHGENGIFMADVFCKDCDKISQSQSFLVADHRVRTIVRIVQFNLSCT